MTAQVGSSIMKLRPAVRIPKPWSIQTSPVSTIAIARTLRSGERRDGLGSCIGVGCHPRPIRGQTGGFSACPATIIQAKPSAIIAGAVA